MQLDLCKALIQLMTYRLGQILIQDSSHKGRNAGELKKIRKYMSEQDAVRIKA
jgi:hypothetical protein